MKSLISERRSHGCICPVCHQPSYKFIFEESYIKPMFRCTGCGRSWASGYDGKPYSDFLSPEDIPLFEKWKKEWE